MRAKLRHYQACAAGIFLLPLGTLCSAVPIFESEQATLYMSGFFATHQLNADGDTSLQDGPSRLRIGLTVPAAGNWDVGFNLEWGINAISSSRNIVIKGDQETAPGDAGDSLFLRQGHAFAEHDYWGELVAGKQWSVYYDVTRITDWYHVSGGLGSGTFSLSSDGGITGTGRADAALTWRKQFPALCGEMQIGLQYQAHVAEFEIELRDVAGENTLLVCPEGECVYDISHGISFTWQRDIGEGLFLGATYNRAQIDASTERGLLFDITAPEAPILIRDDIQLDASSNSWALAVGGAYGRGAFEQGLYAALVFQRSQNNELAPPGTVEGGTNFYDAKGSESFISYTWGANDCFSVYGGHNILESDDSAFERTLLDGNKFRVAGYFLGAQYRWDERIRLYFEGGYSDSTRNAEPVFDGFLAVGVRIDI